METDRIKEKIKNLRNRTVENGATKEEAETASMLAQRLINKYGLEKPKVATKQQKQMVEEAEVKVYKRKKGKHLIKKILYFYLATKISSFIFSVLLLCLISLR